MKQQLILFLDGSCSISQNPYHSENHAKLQFSSSSSLMTVEKRATKLRFLTCAAPVEYHQAGQLLIEFRNNIIGENVIFPDNLIGPKRADNAFQTAEPLLVCRFEQPAIPRKSILEGEELYWIEISSIDQLVRLRVPSHLQTFEVTFPGRIAESDESSTPNAYTMVSQIHSSFDPPKYWVYPLLLAIQSEPSLAENPDFIGLKRRLESLSIAYQLLDMKHPAQPFNLNSKESSEFDLMPNVVLSTNHVTFKLPPFNHLEYQPSHSSNTQFRGHDYISSLTKAAEIKALKCDLGMFRAIKFNSETVEIQIILPDGTIIQSTSDFKFLRMWLKGSWVEEMYLVEMVMDLGSFTNHHSGEVYQMREIATMALSIYQNVHSNILTTSSITDETKNQISFSSTAKRTIEIPDIGKFTYFTDGRCKAHFNDRNIIEFPSNFNYNGIASIIDQSGNIINVRISNPVGYEDHVHSMLDFIDYVENRKKKAIAANEKQKVVDRLTLQRAKSREHSRKLQDLILNHFT